MRLIAAFACLTVAIENVGMALGIESPLPFAPEAAWLWWPLAALWVAAGIRILLNGVP